MSNIKYAYLIIAYNNSKQLQKLISMIDDSRNDIYLIVDRKSNLTNYKFHVNFSSIFYLRPIKIYWGSYSQIEAELKLFKASVNEKYAYYHLLSGQDLPLTNQDVIHNFFDSHLGYEFIQYQSESFKDINEKLNHHMFINHFDSGLHSEHCHNMYLSKLFFSVYRHIETLLLRNIPEHNIPFNNVSMASQWLSIDYDLVNYIVRSASWIRKHFYYGKVIDELFIPTLINYLPRIKSKVYDNKIYTKSPCNPFNNLRYIKKSSSATHPKILTLKDFTDLKHARNRGYLFARKFNENVDNNIIYKIFKDVMKE